MSQSQAFTAVPVGVSSASLLTGFKRHWWPAALLLCMAWSGVAVSQAGAATPANSLDLELGLFSFTRNDVRIPGDTGTKFALDDLTDTSGVTARLQGTWWLNERHALRLTAAPLSTSGTGVLDQDVDFAGERFAAGQATRGEYRFNTYRLTWRYRFEPGERWEWGAGAAVLVRDARIRLTQGNLSAKDDDLGVVPLLHANGRYRLSERTSLVMDFEGLWSPQGRAFDVAVRAERDFANGWYGHVGLRTLEGGADNDDVYAFAWIHFATLGLGYRF
ncbi:MAG: hypothetical protein ACXIUM_02690 [Wenzhouxiangella sp.]